MAGQTPTIDPDTGADRRAALQTKLFELKSTQQTNSNLHHACFTSKWVSEIYICQKNKKTKATLQPTPDLDERASWKSLLITWCHLLRTPDSVWTPSWWDDRWPPAGPPHRPGSGHQSTSGRSAEAAAIRDVPEVTDWIQVWRSGPLSFPDLERSRPCIVMPTLNVPSWSPLNQDWT